jgi:uncharacterized protein YfaS (alpha-2-macroglobulin family)
MKWQRERIQAAAIVAAIVVVVAGLGGAIAKHLAPDDTQGTIGVYDVQVDKQKRAWVDIIFDHPIATAAGGRIVSPAPASIEPELAGVWRWRSDSVLRFEPAGGFPAGVDYAVSLNLARFVGAGQRFRGDGELKVRIDGLMVEKVVTFEEPAGDRKAVVLRGEIHFNYPIDPALLVVRASLVDGDDTRPIEIVDGYTSQVLSFRTHPIAKGHDARTVKLVIGKGLPENTHGAKLEKDYVREIAIGSSDHLVVRAVEPQSRETDSTLRIELSSAVNPDVASKFVSLTPAAKYHVSVQANELYLTGAFAPGTAYTLKIAKGLPGTDDARLDDDYAGEVTFPDLKQKLDFQSEGMFLSAAGYKTLAVESVNVGRAVVAVDRVYRNNIFHMLLNDYWYPYHHDNRDEEGEEGDEETPSAENEITVDEISHSMGDRIAQRTLTLQGARNHEAVTTLSLEPYIKAHEPGFYRVTLAGARPLDQQVRWILITDLGIVAKYGEDSLMVWVSSFKDLGAIDGATVSLISDQNQLLASGQTDSRGLWRMQGLEKISKARKMPFMITVQKGSEFSFLVFGKTEVDVSPFDTAGDSVPKNGYSAFVYGERDIYRPGESVKGMAVVRTRDLQAPPRMPLVAKHRDSESERESFRVDVGDSGVAPFRLDLPPYARTGRHSIDLLAGKDVIGTYNFQVEEFVPDRIKVELRPKKPRAAPGDDLVYAVAGTYLFGPPAANLAVETRVRLVSSLFQPKGFEAFTFNNSDRKFDPREIENESGTLDAAGLKEFHAAIPPGMLPPGALDAIISSRVQEQGGRGVAAVAHVPVHPWPYYVGVRRADNPDGSPSPGKAVPFEWVAVGLDGKETKAGALRAELFEDEWHTVLRRSSSGSYDYQSTRESRVLTTRAIAAGSSRGTFTFIPSAYRTYRVVIGDPETGASSQLDFSAGGWGYSPWAMKNPGRLKLELDKAEYAPGEEAVLEIKAPFPGKLLVTLERDEVYYSSIETLTGNSAKIRLPLTAGLRPNAYITATLVRAAADLEPGEAGRAFGAIPINVDREANRLHPVIKAPPDLRSNHKLPVEVTTEPGATVTIAVVDEGILQLIQQKTADPHAFFYRKLSLGVATYDIFASLLPEVKPKRKGPAGGGEDLEGLSQYVRADSIRRAKPVSFWSGPLIADAGGKARAAFDIPDFQGGVRIMAVVHRGRHFGNAELMTKVHDPIVLMPTFPRFLNVRDQVQVPVTVRNDTGRGGRFVVRANGAQLPADIPNGAEKTLYFPIQAPAAPADLAIEITASGNGESAKASSHVGVRWDLPAESVESTGRFNEQSALFRNEVLEQFVPGSTDRTLAISPLPLVQFRGKLSELLRYPYGCVEQTTSTVFPLIYFGDIAQELDPEAFARGDAAAMVREGIRRLGTMQTYSGGFSMWPYGTTPDPWGSVYATHFLVEARRAGHEVQPAMLDRARAYIATDAKAKSDYDSFELQRVVYALYVLARAGKPDIGTMDYIREHKTASLAPQSKALLAAAYAAAGNPKTIDTLLAGVTDVEKVYRQTGGNLDSAIRNRALLLLALLDAAPSDNRIPPLVERLTRDLSDHFWSTQESAFTLIALGQLAHRQHAQSPYGGTVLADGKPVGTFTSKTVVFRHIRGTKIEVVMNPGYQKGAAYFSMSTRGIRTAASFRPESSGIDVTRELLTRDGKPLDPKGIQQGDLVVSVVKVSSTNGALNNVVVQSLIPSGLEVENPRLKSSETFTWLSGEVSACTNVDIRDDQVLYFVELPERGTLTFYTLLRAVTPGTYQQPPVFAEAMYARSNHAVGKSGAIVVRTR